MINPSELAKSSAASSSIATAILDKAAERRTQTSTTMVQTSKDYQKAAEVYTEIGKVQAQIAAELAKLADEKISLVSDPDMYQSHNSAATNLLVFRKRSKRSLRNASSPWYS